MSLMARLVSTRLSKSTRSTKGSHGKQVAKHVGQAVGAASQPRRREDAEGLDVVGGNGRTVRADDGALEGAWFAEALSHRSGAGAGGSFLGLGPAGDVPAPRDALAARVARTSCKAVNAATGRQCCLLHGHDGAHVHGRTAFSAVALTDDDVWRARARLDAVATARNFNPLHNASITGGGLS